MVRSREQTATIPNALLARPHDATLTSSNKYIVFLRLLTASRHRSHRCLAEGVHALQEHVMSARRVREWWDSRRRHVLGRIFHEMTDMRKTRLVYVWCSTSWRRRVVLSSCLCSLHPLLECVLRHPISPCVTVTFSDSWLASSTSVVMENTSWLNARNSLALPCVYAS